MRRCLITGGSRGLGRELARAFAQRGYAVALCYRQDRAAAEKAKAELHALAQDVRVVQCDVSDSRQVAETFRTLRAQWECLDVLVNNAAIARDALIARQSPEDWQAVIDVNLSGPFYCLREAAAWMAGRGGHIVNISSISGLEGREGQAAYAAAKAGLIGLTKSAARELGPSNVRVNAILPGLLPTGLTGTMTAGQQERQLARLVLGRAGLLTEVAEFIVHLAEMENVSGQVFNLDNRIVS